MRGIHKMRRAGSWALLFASLALSLGGSAGAAAQPVCAGEADIKIRVVAGTTAYWKVTDGTLTCVDGDGVHNLTFYGASTPSPVVGNCPTFASSNLNIFLKFYEGEVLVYKQHWKAPLALFPSVTVFSVHWNMRPLGLVEVATPPLVECPLSANQSSGDGGGSYDIDPVGRINIEQNPAQ